MWQSHSYRRRRSRQIIGLTCESLEARSLLSVTLLSEDFQSTPTRTLPSSLDTAVQVNGLAVAEVTGPAGRYPEPFGPAGNRSLVVDNSGQAQPALGWSKRFATDPTEFRTGTVSFDLFLTEPNGRDWTYIDVRLGYGGTNRTIPTTVGDTTVWNSFRVNATSPDIVYDNGNGGGSAPITSLSKMHVVYALNGAQHTYRLTINGTPISFGGSLDRNWMPGAPGVNMVAFVGAYPQSSGLVYLDNLLVIQEAAPPTWVPPVDEPTNQLEWYQHRGNQRLTGLANIQEDLVTNAEVLWSSDIASRESWFSMSPNSGSTTLIHPTTDIALSGSGLRDWNLGGPYFDLAGNGALTSIATGPLLRIGDFLPGNQGLEKIEGQVLDTTFGQGVIRLSTYANGGWVQVWESPPIPSMFSIPNLIVGDFDHDGQQEIALTPWYDLYLLNLSTGTVKQKVAFKPSPNESGRPYGWFGAIDLDGDDKSEFVLLGDFQDFVTVLGWDEQGKVSKRWEHVFDPRLANKQTSHRPPTFPVIPFLGNGHAQIVTSVFNEMGDGRWHALIFDANTGALVADRVDTVIDGALDIDGDGNRELLVRRTTGGFLSESAPLEILDWQQGFVPLWSAADAAFVQQPLPDFPLNMSSATSTGKKAILTGNLALGAPPVFFTKQRVNSTANVVQVHVWQTQLGGVPQDMGQSQGPLLDVLAVRPESHSTGSVLIRSERTGSDTALPGDFNQDGQVDGLDFVYWSDRRGSSLAPLGPVDANQNGIVDLPDYAIWKSNYGKTDPQRIYSSGFGGNAVYSQRGLPPRSSAVVGKLHGRSGPATVVVQGGAETIVALQPDPSGHVKPAWVQSGLGAFFGATQNQGQHANSGVALSDVNGDQTLETLFATTGPNGQAQLVAANPDGTPLWTADFDVPGGQRIFNQPGLVAWRTGHFTSVSYSDVLVQLMHGIGGTGEFVLLDGRSGSIKWRRSYGNTPGSNGLQRGAGEAHLAIYDWDRDGLDEAVNFNPDMFYVIDGNGLNLIDRAVYNGGIFANASPLFGTPIVADFSHNGTDTILFAGSYAQLGLITSHGDPIWNTPFVFDNTPGFIQGIGDVDGDGDLDLLSPGHPSAPATYDQSYFHAFDAATGTLLWKVKLPGHPFAPVGGAFSDTPSLSVSGDIDGDGRVESVFAIGDTLYAVGATVAGNSGTIEWSFRPDGGLLGAPIIADGNSDGRAEIIVVSTSGRVYGIGNHASAPANEPALAGGDSRHATRDESFATSPALAPTSAAPRGAEAFGWAWTAQCTMSTSTRDALESDSSPRRTSDYTNGVRARFSFLFADYTDWGSSHRKGKHAIRK